MFLGIFTTLLIPETKRITLEKLAGEYDMSDEVADPEGAVLEPRNELSGEGVADDVVKTEPSGKSP